MPGTVILQRSVFHTTPTPAYTINEASVIRMIGRDLSFRRNNYFFSAAYQRRRWDGYVHLMRNGVCRMGLLNRVIHALIHNKFTVDDKRSLPEYQLDTTRRIWSVLRDYQREAVQVVVNREIAGYKAPAGIIHLPPRSGKTLIAAAIIDQFWMARPAVFVVERVDLARQSQLVISEALGEAVGLVGDGVADIKPITIITIQSLHAAYNIKYEKIASDDIIEKGMVNKVAVIKMLSTAQVIVIDECQHTCADGYFNALRQAQNAFCVVGLSGTPWVDDGADLLLENACGPVVYKKTYSWMIEQGYLLPLDIYFYRLPPIMCYSGSYSSVYKAAVVDSPVKNGCIKRITEEFTRTGKSVAILTVYKNHAKTLHEMIKGSVLLTGDDRGLYRHQVYQQLNRKEVMVIVSTVFSEGIDVPSLDVGINADGGKDSRRIFQRLRMQTPHPGKKRGIYVDFLHEEKYLRDHAKRRLSFYEQERLFKVHIRDPRLELKLAYPNVGLE